MTGSDANDPRAKLAPGMYDAGEAAMGIKHLMLLKKPDAFQLGSDDPDDPKVKKTLGLLGIGDPSKMPKPIQVGSGSDWLLRTRTLRSRAITCFRETSMASISMTSPIRRRPALLTSMVCPGGQGDRVGLQEPAVHVGGDAERPAGLRHRRDFRRTRRRPAGQENKPTLPAAQKDRFRGVRIFDISDVKNPKQVAAVQTCRGSHTHTLVVDPNDKNNVYIYVSGTSFVRQSEELAGCSGEAAGQGSEYGAVSH